MKAKKAMVWQIWQLGSINIGTDQNLCIIKLYDFKIGLIKWHLNFESCTFGLKSYLWFQIELTLRARSILKSRVWFSAQIALHSVQLPLWIGLHYHYPYLARTLDAWRGSWICVRSKDCAEAIRANVVKDVRAQNFPRTDFFKTLTAGGKWYN